MPATLAACGHLSEKIETSACGGDGPTPDFGHDLVAVPDDRGAALRVFLERQPRRRRARDRVRSRGLSARGCAMAGPERAPGAAALASRQPGPPILGTAIPFRVFDRRTGSTHRPDYLARNPVDRPGRPNAGNRTRNGALSLLHHAQVAALLRRLAAGFGRVVGGIVRR